MMRLMLLIMMTKMPMMMMTKMSMMMTKMSMNDDDGSLTSHKASDAALAVAVKLDSTF